MKKSILVDLILLALLTFCLVCKMALICVGEELCKSWEKSGKMELLVLFLD